MVFLFCLSPIFSLFRLFILKSLMYDILKSLMYDISTIKAPSLIQQLFTKAGNVHGYGTRSATRGNYYVKSSRLEIKKKKTRFRFPAPLFGTAYL